MLDWYRHGRAQLITAVLLGFGAPASVLGYNLFVSGEGFTFFTRPQPTDGSWLFLVALPFVGAFLLYNSFNRAFVAAGAGWVAHNTGWVRTYELVQVKIEIDTQPYLLLLDRDLRVTRPPLREIQQNRELWDLVHNGILHSFQERHVHTNQVARRILHLHAPAMRNDLRLAREGPRPDEFVIVDRPRRWWRRTPRRYRRGQQQV